MIRHRNAAELAALTAALLAAPALASDRTAEIDALFTRWSDETPGCAVGVAEDGAPVATRAYGLAELEHRVPATTATIYEAGSVSKQFTAAAILMLERDGRLSLSDDVRQHIPELPDYGATITLEHLLTHTSGLRDWGSVAAIEGWPRGTRAANHDHVLDIIARQRSLNFAPGSEWLYSNSGYNLLAMVVQRVSGQSLDAFTRARLFEPLGMTHTRWRDDYTAVVPGRATAYDRRPDGYHLDMPFENAHGNGGLLTTVGDLLIWNAALDSGALGEGFAERLAQRGVADGRPTHYGLGLQHGEHRGVAEISHGGATGGYRAWLGRYPTEGVSVALLCNTGEASSADLGRAVAALFLPEGDAPPAYVPEGEPPTGLFANSRTGEPFGLRFAGGALRSLPQGRELTPVRPGRYRLGGDDLVFTSPDSFNRLTADGAVVPYRRETPVQPTPAELAAYEGVYVSDEAPARIAVAMREGRLWLRRPGSPPTPLAPTYADVFAGPAGVVSFDRDASGAVTGFHFNNGRVRAMAFARAE